MPIFGAHLSVAGGLHHAITAAIDLHCDTVQIFTKNANQWNAPPLSADAIERFRRTLRDSGLRFPTAHDSYLINLASPKDELWQRSIEAFHQEIERAEALGLSYLVTHPGAHTGSGVPVGCRRVASALSEILRRCQGYQVMILLETTAGQGTTLGSRFEELRAILDQVQQPEQLGICLDTCHIFAAGYPIQSASDFTATFQQFDEHLGLTCLKLFHLNDSVKP